MSLESVFTRIAELNSVLGGAAAPAATATAATTAHVVERRLRADAAQRLRHRLDDRDRGRHADPARRRRDDDDRARPPPAPSPPSPRPTGNSPAARMVAMAQAEVGQAEQPPGSNNSPRIAQYRSATAGAPGPGPWCAYFTSWLARGAGVPVGDHGQGFGSVDALYAWAQKSGRAIPASSGQDPARATSSSGTSTSASSSPSARTAASRRSRATPPTASPAASTPRATRSGTCA